MKYSPAMPAAAGTVATAACGRLNTLCMGKSPSHVPPNQDGQGKKVHGIIFIRVQEPKRVFDIKIFFGELSRK